MKKIFMITLFFCFVLCFVQAQNIVATDSAITYTPGEGLTLKVGKQDGYKFNINATVQSGLQFNQYDSVNNNRLSINLVRLGLNASLLKDKIRMGLLTDFTGSYPILEGWIGFSIINKKSWLYLGQKQTHTNNRLAMSDERFAQNLGQTIAGKSNDGIVHGGLIQNFVGASREAGLFLETGFSFGQWKIYPSASITTGEGQNFFELQNNTGFKYGGRVDVLPLGDFIKNNAFIAEDIYREPAPKLALGMAASYNVKSASSIGSDNANITGIYNKNGEADFANYGKIIGDFIFKFNGFSLVGEYANNTVRGRELYTNAAASNRLTPEAASGFYNMGSAYNLQTSYVTSSKWSIGGRYTHIQPENKNETSLIREQSWYTFTLNKFIKNNALKTGVNASYVTEDYVTTKSKRWLYNIAIQISL